MDGHRQHVEIFLEGRSFGLPVESVREVIRPLPVTRIPHAPPGVLGLINLRGQVVPMIDLRGRMGRAGAPPGGRGVQVILHTDDGPVGLLVDEVGHVLDMSDADFDLPPETVRGTVRQLLKGTYKFKDRLLLALDVDQILRLDPAAGPANRPT